VFAKTEAIRDILESEAFEKYYIDEATEPAVLLLHKNNILTRGAWHVYMNMLARVIRTGKEKEARSEIENIFNSTTKRIKVYKVSTVGRKQGKRILHGEYRPHSLRSTTREVKA